MLTLTVNSDSNNANSFTCTNIKTVSVGPFSKSKLLRKCEKMTKRGYGQMGSTIEMLIPKKEQLDDYVRLLRDSAKLSEHLRMNQSKYTQTPIVCKDAALSSKSNLTPLEKFYLYELEAFIIVECY